MKKGDLTIAWKRRLEQGSSGPARTLEHIPYFHKSCNALCFGGLVFSIEKKTYCHSNETQTIPQKAKNFMSMGKSGSIVQYQENNIFLLKTLTEITMSQTKVFLKNEREYSFIYYGNVKNYFIKFEQLYFYMVGTGEKMVRGNKIFLKVREKSEFQFKSGKIKAF